MLPGPSTSMLPRTDARTLLSGTDARTLLSRTNAATLLCSTYARTGTYVLPSTKSLL